MDERLEKRATLERISQSGDDENGRKARAILAEMNKTDEAIQELNQVKTALEKKNQRQHISNALKNYQAENIEQLLLLIDHENPSALADLFNEDASLNEARLNSFMQQVRQDYPNYFQQVYKPQVQAKNDAEMNREIARKKARTIF